MDRCYFGFGLGVSWFVSCDSKSLTMIMMIPSEKCSYGVAAYYPNRDLTQLMGLPMGSADFCFWVFQKAVPMQYAVLRMNEVVTVVLTYRARRLKEGLTTARANRLVQKRNFIVACIFRSGV